MKLKTRFLLLMSAIFVGFILITWLLSQQLLDKINQQWGEQFSQRQVLYDKYRTLMPLLREIALARQMAAEPAITDMALSEHDPEMRRRGIAAMERYRLNFRGHSYFAAFTMSGNYYFNNADNQYADQQLRYVLSPDRVADKWFYATLADGNEYQVNLDPDVHLNVTKVWINVLIRNGDKVLGVIGTGIDLTEFLKETVSIAQPGVDNLFIDRSMAIQLNSDPALIDYMTIAKDINQRVKVDVLLKNPDDIEHLRQVMRELERSPADNTTLWVNYQGKRHLLGVAYLPEIGWYDLTLMDDHSLDIFNDLVMWPILFSLALLLILLGVGWALRSWILNPIATLRTSTEKIRDGDFDVDPPIAGSGEIADLSRSFERMAISVINSQRDLEEKVQERTEELHRLTEIDPLTGLLNRRGMMDRLGKEIARQARQGDGLGLLMLDLDYFKRINDSYGHMAGDLALCEVAKVIQASKRGYDHVARWGGEEFMMLLPECAKTDLLAIAERIRESIHDLKIQAGSQVFAFTISIGAHRPATPQTLDTMLQKVDDAMYAAKEAGRDCVRFSE